MAVTFEQILKDMKAEQAKLLEAKTMEWYLNQIKNVVSRIPSSNVPKRGPTERQQKQAKKDVKDTVMSTQSGMTSDLSGKMIFYTYDPKHKKTLPYYDIFPLVFPLEPVQGSSFLGLNLHYLPPMQRAKFMTALYTLINTTNKMGPRTRLRLKYKFLKEASKFSAYKPCIKRYLTSHIQSRIMVIDPNQWNYVLMLPLARFLKKSEMTVWQDSIRIIAGTR